MDLVVDCSNAHDKKLFQEFLSEFSEVDCHLLLHAKDDAGTRWECGFVKKGNNFHPHHFYALDNSNRWCKRREVPAAVDIHEVAEQFGRSPKAIQHQFGWVHWREFERAQKSSKFDAGNSLREVHEALLFKSSKKGFKKELDEQYPTIKLIIRSTLEQATAEAQNSEWNGRASHPFNDAFRLSARIGEMYAEAHLLAEAEEISELLSKPLAAILPQITIASRKKSLQDEYERLHSVAGGLFLTDKMSLQQMQLIIEQLPASRLSESFRHVKGKLVDLTYEVRPKANKKIHEEAYGLALAANSILLKYVTEKNEFAPIMLIPVANLHKVLAASLTAEERKTITAQLKHVASLPGSK